VESTGGFGLKNKQFCATQGAERSLFLKKERSVFCVSFFLINILKSSLGFHFSSILIRINTILQKYANQSD
jgi:hypothetical protein